MHTSYSDGKDSMLEMIRCALEIGYEEICFTDHVRKETKWIDDYLEEINARRKEFFSKIHIIAGVETKLCNWLGGLDVPEGICDKKVRIVAAVHRIPNEDGSVFFRKDEEFPKERLAEFWKKTLDGVHYNKDIQCIAHPFNWEERLDLNIQNEKLIRKLVTENNNLQIEYNVKYDNSWLEYKTWQQLGDRVVVGSDSHSVEEMALRKRDVELAHMLIWGENLY